MSEGATTVDDPHRDHRLMTAIPAAFLLGASGFFTTTIRLHPDGTHGDVLGIEPVRTIVLAVIALLAVYFAARPMSPDPRIAQAVMLAGAIIAVVVSVDAFATAYRNPDLVSGVAPYLQVFATAGFLVLRWKRGLWPTSRWMIEAQQEASGRSRRRLK